MKARTAPCGPETTGSTWLGDLQARCLARISSVGSLTWGWMLGAEGDARTRGYLAVLVSRNGVGLWHDP